MPISSPITFLGLLSTLPFLYPIASNAANDWSTACAGSCAYESGDGRNTAWGTTLLDGSPEVVSDISTAAGWSIMDCDDTSTEAQDVRIVCHNPDAGCARLFEGGAENTIVRLPEECAAAPFARIVSITTSSNQTLTRKVSKLMSASSHHSSTPPEVMTITIDYDFNLIPASRGTVSLTVLATTNPLQRPMTNSQAIRRALGYSESGELNARSGNSASELVRREALRRDLFADFVRGNTIPKGTAFKTRGSSRSSPPTAKSEKAARWLDWEANQSHQFDVIDIQQVFPVIDAGPSCPENDDRPAFDAKIKVDAELKARAVVSIGFIVHGSIIPPAITKAAFTSALDGGVEAAFNISAVAHGPFDTGLLRLHTFSLSRLSIPGILDVGPWFSINGQGVGNISVCTDAVVTANYSFPSLSMVYPQDEGPSTGRASQEAAQNPLALSVGDSASREGQISVHIIPRVDFGVSILFGLVSASVFLEVDGYGELNMGLEANAGASTTSSTCSYQDTLASVRGRPPTPCSSSEAAVTTLEKVASSTGSSEWLKTTDFPMPTPAPQKRDALLGHEGRDVSDPYCVGVNVGVKIVAGAEGRLLSFWNATASFELFAEEWPVFNQCFNGATKRELPPFRRGFIIPTMSPATALLGSRHRRQPDDLVCPAATDSLSADNRIV